MICKYSINGQTCVFYNVLLFFCMVDGWLESCFVNGVPIDLLRTVAKLAERDAHTLGSFFGFPLAPLWPEPEVCFDIACAG